LGARQHAWISGAAAKTGAEVTEGLDPHRHMLGSGPPGRQSGLPAGARRATIDGRGGSRAIGHAKSQSRGVPMKTQKVMLLLVALLLTSGVRAMAAEKPAGDAVLGKWWFPKKNGQFEITKAKGIYTGRVIAYDDPDALDKNNPDPTLAKRKFIGIEMLSSFKYDPGENQWLDGTIYDGDSGKTYSCTLWFEKGKPAELRARGYIGISLLGRTEVFQRVTAEDEKAAAQKKTEKGK
jgi:uncharacterized protein (DUF2147 family)